MLGYGLVCLNLLNHTQSRGVDKVKSDGTDALAVGTVLDNKAVVGLTVIVQVGRHDGE